MRKLATARRLRTLAGVALLAGIVVFLWPSALGGATTLTVVVGPSMEPTYHRGDLLLVRQGNYDAGDAVVYRIPADEPGAGNLVVHRLVEQEADGTWLTQGDNRDSLDPWRPTNDDILGRSLVTVPKAGFLWMLFAGTLGIGLILAVIVTTAFWPERNDTGEAEEEEPVASPIALGGARPLGVRDYAARARAQSCYS